MNFERLIRYSVLVLTLTGFGAAQTLNRNLVVNGDAEAGPAVHDAADDQVADIPGWTRTGASSVGSYGGGSFLNQGDYGAANRGRQFFYGGPARFTGDGKPERSTISQAIDLSGAAFDIDAGRVRFALSGSIGWSGASYEGIETTSLKVAFLDAAGATLLEAVAPGPAIEDIDVAAGLLVRTTNGFVLPGTRQARVTLDLSSTEKGYNGLAADDLSLVLTTAPAFGVNLLVNGNAEAAQGPAPGWNAHTDISAQQYGYDAGFEKSDPGPADRGQMALRCFTNKTPATAFQTVDISAVKAMVDRGVVGFEVSAWMGGGDSPDTATLTLEYLDAAGAQLGSAQLGQAKPADRGGRLAMIQYSANGNSLPAGTRRLKLKIVFDRLRTDPENMNLYVDNVSLALTSPVNVVTAVNAASSQAAGIAPGEFVSIYGTGLGTNPGTAVAGMQKTIGKVKARFNGVDAFLTYAGAGQINALVPYGIAGKADVEVEYDGNRSNWFTVDVVDSAPGIFTQQYGGGPAWVVNADWSWNSPQNAAARGSSVAFFATGQGLVNPSGTDGETISGPTYPASVLPVKVVIGGVETDPLFAGLIFTGVLQVNVRIPDNAPTGAAVGLRLKIGGAMSRGDVTIAVKAK